MLIERYDNCYSNEFQDWYLDIDLDGLGGSEVSFNLCTDIVELEGSVLNSEDLDDGCYSNEYQDWYLDLDLFSLMILT